MPPDSAVQLSPIDALDHFVATQIGPICLERFQDSDIRSQIEELLTSGAALDDAALRFAHQEAIKDPGIADEFLGHFLTAMMRIGHFSVNDGLRRFLDSGDLVNSVAGSVWQDLARIEFNTRREFLAYLGKRLQWKAADKLKGLSAGKRRQDLHCEVDFEVVGLGDSNQAGPSTLAGNQEEMDRLIVAMVRLPLRDQKILRGHLRGENHAQIAEDLDMNVENARKALQRAIQKVKKFL